jgi:F-type H+-transporting ATPase subunit epsilon
MSSAHEHAPAENTGGSTPIHYEIVTPMARIAAGECDRFVAPAINGEIGILRNHAPFIGALDIGVMRAVRGNTTEAFFVANGFIEVLNNKVVILAEIAEKAEAIDRARAEKSLKRAEERLVVGTKPAAGGVHDRLRARRAQTRARARLKAAGVKAAGVKH